jgi:hypothetical protein
MHTSHHLTQILNVTKLDSVGKGVEEVAYLEFCSTTAQFFLSSTLYTGNVQLLRRINREVTHDLTDFSLQHKFKPQNICISYGMQHVMVSILVFASGKRMEQNTRKKSRCTPTKQNITFIPACQIIGSRKKKIRERLRKCRNVQVHTL